jgi:hypothetical protein
MTANSTLSLAKASSPHSSVTTISQFSDPWRVVWRNGEGCGELAKHLTYGLAVPVHSDLGAFCIDHRAEILVTHRLDAFDLVSRVVPVNVDLTRIDSISAAVFDGPNAALVAAVADRLATRLGVPAEIATVYRSPEELPAAMARIERLSQAHPNLGRRIARAESAVGLLDTLGPRTLLIAGAPDGSWFHRQLWGPGPASASQSSVGAIVVKSAPLRCFHAAIDPAGHTMSPGLSVAEARRRLYLPSAPVAHDGRLVGIVRRRAIDSAADDAVVGDVMEVPVSVRATESISAVGGVRVYLDDGPVPVVDGRNRLIGIVPSVATEAAAEMGSAA